MDKNTEALAKNNTKPERAQKEEITSDHKNTTGLVTAEVMITKGVEDDGQEIHGHETPQDAPFDDDDNDFHLYVQITFSLYKANFLETKSCKPLLYFSDPVPINLIG